MRVVSNGDTILVMRDPQFFVGVTHTVGVFYPEDNRMVMVDGQAKYLSKALDALRKYQGERNLSVLPVRVEYW